MKAIAVTGGKGGTGKSTIATALAVELAKTRKVLLVDMDADCPNDHLILDIKRKLFETVSQRVPLFTDKCTRCGLCASVCKYNALVSVKGKQPILMQQQCNGCGACQIRCPADAISWKRKEVGFIYSASSSFDFLSAELKVTEPISETIIGQLKEITDKKKDSYDYIIIDTAAGTKCDVISALENCDIALAVTEPTPLGQHDLNLILELLAQLNVKPYIVLNRSTIGDIQLIKEIARLRKAEIVAEIPYSKTIAQEYSEGKQIRIQQIHEIIRRISR